MDNKQKFLKQFGFSEEFITEFNIYIDSVDYESEESQKAKLELDDSTASENLIIDKIQNQVYIINRA
ncbi:MAG: hypothetical protein IPG12_03290 [Saprospiraceae bacterium]|nr:hypothetical protein [Saprospiraceae bacterium]